MDIKTNEWYTLGQLFAAELESYGGLMSRKLVVGKPTFQPTHLTPTNYPRFRGSEITLQLYHMGDMSDSLEDYILPFGPPKTKDRRDFVEISLDIEEAWRGNIMASEHGNKSRTFDISVPCRYRARMKIKDEDYVSNGAAGVFEYEENDNFVVFCTWRDMKSGKMGYLGLPYDIEKLSPIEIMLEPNVIDVQASQTNRLYSKRNIRALPITQGRK